MSRAAADDLKRAGARRGKREATGAEVLAAGTLLYFAVGGVFLLYADANPLAVIPNLSHAFASFVAIASVLVPWWAWVAALAPFFLIGTVRRRLWERKFAFLAALIYCTAFTIMFGMVKNRLFLAVPFWADPTLMQLDKVLHFGHVPSEALRGLSSLNTDRLSAMYLNSWVLVVTYFPALLIAIDRCEERRRVFTKLWMVCWIVLGNLVAVAFMSYGPIFSDLFDGGEPSSYPALFAMFDRGDAGGLMMIKMHLWHAYTGDSQSIGSGISAFPSVHVGMATVVGLYLAKLGRDFARDRIRSRPLAQAIAVGSGGAAVLYVSFYLLLSVYLGWHYAVDGYVSILLIGGSYVLLRSRRPSPAGAYAVSCVPNRV